jgi:hypothetical protein
VPLFTLTFAGASFAQATPEKKAEKKAAQPCAPAKTEKKMEQKAEKPKAPRITGEVASVDAKAGTLTVKAKDKEMSFTAPTKALEKVKVGDRVRVSYTEKDGKLSASSVTPAKAEAKAKGMEQKAEAKGMEKKAEKKDAPKTEKK